MLFQKYLFHACDFWYLHFACKQHFHPLNLRQLLSVGQEQLHVVIVVVLQEIIEAVLYAELLALIRKQAYINDGEQIFRSFDLYRTSIHNYKVLLSHWT